MSTFVIYLIGVPAVGKSTIAREIGRRSGAKVVENQLVNFPVFSIVGYDGQDSFELPPGAWDCIAAIRDALLTLVRDHCPPHESFVFTNVLEASASDEALFRRIEEIASHRQAAFVPVWLTCDADALRERKDSADRRRRLKDTDLSNIDHYLERFELLELPHPNGLTLDTSRLVPGEAAERILERVSRVS